MNLTNVLGYCMRCKAKRIIENAKVVDFSKNTKTQRKAVKGICPNCGCNMYRVISKKDAENI